MSLPSNLQINDATCEKMSRMCSHLDSQIQSMSDGGGASSDMAQVAVGVGEPGTDPLFSVYVPVDFSRKLCVQLPVEVADALRFLSYKAGRRATQRDILCNLVLSAARGRGYEG